MAHYLRDLRKKAIAFFPLPCRKRIVSFTIANAVARLTGSRFNLFLTQNGQMSNVQQLQRINQVLEQFWLKGSWPGLHTEATVTSSGGVITLDASYLRLDGLAASKDFTAPDTGCWSKVDIKAMQYRWQPGGPGYFDPTDVCGVIAYDLGDVGGVRKYQLTGETATLDTYKYRGFARKRYVWATADSTVVTPDCYPALEMGVRAYNAEDEQADNVDALWAKAFQALDDSMGQMNQGNDFGTLQTDPAISMGMVPNLV